MPRTKLSPEEERQLSTYFALLHRYQNLPVNRMMPLTAVRMLCIKRGYGSVTSAMMRWSEHVLAGYACDGLNDAARSYMFVVNRDLLPAEHREGVLATIKMTYQAATDKYVKADIVRILARVLRRERYLKERVTRQAHAALREAPSHARH